MWTLGLPSLQKVFCSSNLVRYAAIPAELVYRLLSRLRLLQVSFPALSSLKECYRIRWDVSFARGERERHHVYKVCHKFDTRKCLGIMRVLCVYRLYVPPNALHCIEHLKPE